MKTYIESLNITTKVITVNNDTNTYSFKKLQVPNVTYKELLSDTQEYKTPSSYFNTNFIKDYIKIDASIEEIKVFTENKNTLRKMYVSACIESAKIIDKDKLSIFDLGKVYLSFKAKFIAKTFSPYLTVYTIPTFKSVEETKLDKEIELMKLEQALKNLESELIAVNERNLALPKDTKKESTQKIKRNITAHKKLIKDAK